MTDDELNKIANLLEQPDLVTREDERSELSTAARALLTEVRRLQRRVRFLESTQDAQFDALASALKD